MRVRETNAKCDISHEVKGDQTPPTVQVKFSELSLLFLLINFATISLPPSPLAADGSELTLDGATHTALDMIATINSRSRSL